MDGNAEIAVGRELGIRELRFFSQVGYGGGAACGCVQHAAMAVATGTADVVVCYRALNERSGRRFGQVAAGLAGMPDHGGDRQRLALPDGTGHARGHGRDDRPPVHARLRGDERGLRQGGRRRPPPRREQPERLVLPASGHAGRASGVALDRRAAAPARLLPGERRRRGRGRHEPRARPRPAAPARRDRRRGPGERAGAVHHDELLPRRSRRASRDGRGRQATVAAGGHRPGRRAGPRSSTTTSRRTCLSSSKNSASASGARPGISSPTARSRWAAACRSTRTAASSARPTSTA